MARSQLSQENIGKKMLMKLQLKFKNGFEEHVNVSGDKKHPVDINEFVPSEQSLESWYVERIE